MNKLTLIAIFLIAMLPSLARAQLVVNEISQGATSAKEYVEFVVKGTRTCTDSAADIRHWIVDDNNGWLGSGAGQGIATGCLRFSNDATWASVPYGSIILLYDDANKNTSITLADDPSDANNDKVYVIPVTSLLIEKNTTSPSAPSSSGYTYPTTGFTPGGDWTLIGLANGGDAVITVAPANLGSAAFSFGYGAINNPGAATVYNPTAGAGTVYYLSDNLYTTSASWIAGNAPADETPGTPNSANNALWIASLRLSVGGLIPQTQTNTISGCGSVVFNGTTYTTSTIVKDTIKSTGGCDSIYLNTTITIDNIVATTNTTNLSGCGSVLYNGTTYTSSITLSDTLKSVNGCDSVYNNIIIRVVKPVVQSNTTKGCGSVVFNGITYTSNATVRDTVKSVLGCDSLYRITRILIQNLNPVPQVTSFSACRSVVYNGVTYTSTTIVKDTIRSSYGCDSVYRTTTIIIQDIAPLIQTIFLAGCDSVVYNNNTYTASTSTKDTIRSSFGCDSILINLNVKVTGPAQKDSITIRACDSATYNGITYNDSTVVRDTLRTALGCDSLYKIANILIKHLQPVPMSDTLIGCNKITFNGVEYTDSTIVMDTVKTAEGCDSIYRTTNIIIITGTPATADTSITSCTTIVINGVTYDSTTIFTDTLKTSLGCDSLLRTTHLTILNITPITVKDTLTGCNKVVYNGITYNTSTVIQDTVQTASGCDSIYNIHNIVIKINAVTQTNSFTSCSSIFYNGTNYTSSATVRDTIRNAAGCDSIYKVTNIIIQNIRITNNITISGCDSAVFNGITYTTSVIIRDTVRTAQFCDSIYNITNIVVKHITPVSKTDTIKGCNSLVFNGVTYTASTVVLDTLKTPEGCDSLYRTNRLVIQSIVPVSTTTALTGCNSLVYNGTTYTASTTITDTTRTLSGCDSLYHFTNINIISPITATNTVTGCHGSVIFNGVTYTTSTIVLDTLKSVFGCDSIYRTNTIHVENITPVNKVINLSGCGSVIYNGVTYTAPTVLKDTLLSIGGCDSIYRQVNISIVITPVVNAVTLNGCGSVIFNGTTYTTSIIINDTLRTAGGCDSIYNITSINVQNITPVNNKFITRGCNGSVVFNGITYTASTVIKDTVRSSIGCDSIYNTNRIIVENIVPVTNSASLSDCQSITFNGITYTISTIVRDSLKTVGGCDSIYNITTITINAPITTSVTLNGCNSLVFNGTTYTTSTVINDTTKSITGCDSLYHITNINVQHVTPKNESNTIAGCNSLTLNGITYTANTVLYDTLISIGGCDSVYSVTNIIVQHVTAVSVNTTLNGCVSLTYNGITYTASTVVKDTTRSVGGCDSLYNTTTINIVTPISVVNNLQGCNSFVFNGITYTNSAVVSDTVKSITGCDSLYRTNNINIQHITPVPANNLAAGCNSVTFNGITYTASTVVKDTLKTTLGCDSIFRTTVILVQNVTPVAATKTLYGCGSLTYLGITYTASTVISDTTKSLGGCDSLYNTTTINIVTPIATVNNIQGCNSVVFNGVTYTASTVVSDTVKSMTGCDSLYRTNNINIQFITPVSAGNVVAGCNSVTFNGVTYIASTTVLDTLRTTLGCDSIFRTNYIVVQFITPVTNVRTLYGCGSLVYNGVTYTTSTVVSDTTKSIGGCDSLYNTTTINIVTPIATVNNIQGCNSVVFNGVTYTASTVVSDTVKSITGCDSLYRTNNINIQFITPVSAGNVVAGCNSVTFNGVTYTASTTVLDTLRTTLGCDSIFRTNYIVVQFVTPVSNVRTLYGCGSLVYNGVTYTASTVVSDTTKSIGGCDSLYNTTTINIVTPIATVNNIQGCNSVVFNGVTYTASTVVSDTVKSITGCDSLYRTNNINIQFITPVSAGNVVAGCNSVTFNGVTYTASTTVFDTLRTTLGCDSIFRTNYIVVQFITPVTNVTTLYGCGSLTYHGITYTSSTVVSDTTKSIGGCDSLYNTTTINIVTPIATVNNIQGCNSVVFNGVTYTASTVVSDTVKSMTGCDSLYRTNNINIQHITPVNGQNVVAGCNSVTFNGVTYTASTTVLDTLRTTLGCDSIFRTNYIVVQFITPVPTSTTLYGCGSLTFHGITYTASTVVKDTTKSIGGCDSLYNTTNINIVIATTVTNTLQGCNSLVFNGITYTASTVLLDTTRSITGCDSVYTITNINIQTITPVPGNNQIRACNSVVFNGVTYTASTIVLDTLRTTVGCDSIFRTNYITIQTITPVTVPNALTGCRSVLFNGTTYTASTVVNDTVRSSFGCDSIYNVTTITVNNLNLSLTANPNPVIVGTNATLTTSAPVPYTIQGWSPAYLFPNQKATSQTFKVDSTREIFVYGISSAGCADTASLVVTIRYLDQIFIPNTFTPNNDGRNDEFRLYGNNIAKADMKIFNQWGQLIFESSDQYKGWNGYFKGQLQPIGVYVYVMKITLTDNSIINKKGTINLVR